MKGRKHRKGQFPEAFLLVNLGETEPVALNLHAPIRNVIVQFPQHKSILCWH